MAVAGESCPALRIARIDGGYYVVHSEGRPSSILSTPELAHDALLSGLNVWIAATDRAALAHLLGAEVRNVATKAGA